ncbi:hypothetical protein OVY01_05090 [Robbsia sp. Bb-Pol-6]|uniref:Uncharacterized protein n=1 Tax=Robbsia betulipollinis TaxID=2981849 RepID=A0ABT3ZJJ5_9BURK|nr:hypothetical protein [Robbsia betulipollinis]MCY0386622.1 hypothetical protein [Robbsia betulipollinis]
MSIPSMSCATCTPPRATRRARAVQALRRTFSSWSWEALSTSGYFDILLAGQMAFAYEAAPRENDARDEIRDTPMARDAVRRQSAR